MTMLAITIMLLAGLTSARLYSIPEGWNTTIHDSSVQYPASGDTGSYCLVSAFPENSSFKQEYVLSDNGTFGLAFLNFNGTGAYYLSVMMGTKFFKNSSSAAVIWTANRNKTLTKNLVLRKSEGQLELLDLESTASVWSPSRSTIAYLGLEETGSFALYNTSREIVWQSLDHPTNVLLPDQRFVTGQRLISNANASTMAAGIFAATMESSGVVLSLYTPFKEQQQPYFLWALTGKTIDSAQYNCSGHIAVLHYTVGGLVQIAYEPEASACSGPIQVALGAGNVLRFLQLEADGNLVSYKLNEANSWQVDFKLTQYLKNGVCNLPLACGRSGICQQNGKCDCLDRNTSNITSQSTVCQQRSWLSLKNCSTKYRTDFVQFSGAAYFTTEYTSPDRGSSSLEDCLNACRLDCSCGAVFYNKIPRNCYFVKDVSGSLMLDGTNSYTAFLKFQDHSKLAVQEGHTSNKLVIIACSVAAATAVIICSFLLLWAFMRKQDAEIAKLLTALHGPPQRFSYRSLVAATKNFSKHLGSGGFGAVFEGVVRDKRLAVKKLNPSNQGEKQFLAEVASLATVSHVNIVKLCGFCVEISHRLLVYEFMPNGSLDQWLFKNQEAPLDWSLRYSIALGTARGLAYLHEESREPIIHLDIKPQNILLDENFVAKVGDFGMAKLLMSRDISQVVTGVRGTPGYLAPELLLHSIATKKCDVYSYGMVLLELIGGRRNLDPTKIESNLSWYFPAWAGNEMQEGNISNIVDPKIRATVDNEQSERMIKVAFWCIQENPADRPTMNAVVQMLEGDEEIALPPLTFRFSVEASGIISIKASSSNIALGYSEDLAAKP